MTRKGKARPPVKDISQAEMLALFDYVETATAGEIFWKASKGNARAGTRAGWRSADDYRLVTVNGVGYKEHRLIYTMIKGPIPPGMEINHINEIKDDNRIDNLRLDTPADNCNHGTRNARLSKPVFCHETSTTYPSVNAAALALNLIATHISKVLNNKYKRTGGKTFSYYTPTTLHQHNNRLKKDNNDNGNIHQAQQPPQQEK